MCTQVPSEALAGAHLGGRNHGDIRLHDSVQPLLGRWSRVIEESRSSICVEQVSKHYFLMASAFSSCFQVLPLSSCHDVCDGVWPGAVR